MRGCHENAGLISNSLFIQVNIKLVNFELPDIIYVIEVLAVSLQFKPQAVIGSMLVDHKFLELLLNCKLILLCDLFK